MADDLDKAIKQLDIYFKTLPALAEDAAFQGMRLALLWLQGEVAALGENYPPYPEKGEAMKRMSPKARRWFFWAVKAGKIRGWKWVKAKGDVPVHPEGHYYRTGKMMASLDSDVQRDDEAITGVIGFGRAYAPWVVGPKYPGGPTKAFGASKPMWQARIHENRWFRFPEEVEKRKDELQQVFIEEFMKEFERLAGR